MIGRAMSGGDAMRRVVRWVFENRQTGAITIAQMPNPALWVVLAGLALRWIWHPQAPVGGQLDCLVTAALIIWALDELLRGVNPWRRTLGAAVLVYELAVMSGWA